jgi:hypothetical protein
VVPLVAPAHATASVAVLTATPPQPDAEPESAVRPAQPPLPRHRWRSSLLLMVLVVIVGALVAAVVAVVVASLAFALRSAVTS